MRMVDLIMKKRDGFELTDEEIKFWIDGYVDGSIPDYQTSAMNMAIYYKGMTRRETSTLTYCMENSGEVVDLSAIKGIKVDKHSTGGVGDKTSLVLGPMVAACGAKFAKMSGRGLGHTGGTLDKLESIPNFNISKTKQGMIDEVNKIGLCIVGQTASLVPADKKMYALRDVTATVDSIPLITASVMSKKLASGTDVILLGVTVGDGAFMKDMDRARELAKSLVSIGKSTSKQTIAVISDMSEPLGNAVGNSLEVIEAINSLKGNGPEDLMELCYTTGSILLVESKLAKNDKEAREMLKNSIDSGAAFNKFVDMVKEQGGDVNYILNPSLFAKSKYQHQVVAKKSGFISKLNALEIGLAAMKLGAGRERLEDKIDMSAGILLSKKVGAYVNKGDVLCTLFTNKENIDDAFEQASNAYEIISEKVETYPVVREIIR